MHLRSVKKMRGSRLLVVLVLMSVNVPLALSQDDTANVRGKIEFDPTRQTSPDGEKLTVPFAEIGAKLRERVIPPRAPLPEGFSDWELAERQKWEKEFLASDAGKAFLEQRKQLFDNAKSFDVKFEKDGKFVIFDVPVGVYGLSGRVDKKIGESTYGFEVFAQIEILEGVDELNLQPLSVAITPLLNAGQSAPPISVKTHDGKLELNLETFQDNYLFLSFWTIESPTVKREQTLVQEMYQTLESKYDLRLLSINVDQDQKKALPFVVENELKGNHGFTGGHDHPTIFNYGVRSYPSFWLIGKDGKILMTQFEIAQAMRVKPSLTAIVSDRIEGKDNPTPAQETDATDQSEK